jgi:hypothetical protein
MNTVHGAKFFSEMAALLTKHAVTANLGLVTAFNSSMGRLLFFFVLIVLAQS